MALKWLEERWEVLMPVLEPLGYAQEKQIKSICEGELLAWKARPSMKQVGSLRKPLTETRNRIRESIPVTQENGWVNPKSGLLEHLALKYLNFSTEEWMQMNMPPQEELQTRLNHPLPLSNPSALLSKAEQLVQMNTWPELVVGIGLSTGRGQVEVLQTGHFTAKSAYSVSFVGPVTIYEKMCAPFEVPTLVRAELVLAALHRLRGFFGNHFVGVERRDISRQCTEHVREAAYRHLWGLMGLRAGERNIYKELSHGVYPRLAILCYCPAWVDEILYMATIQNHRKILEATSGEERLTLATAAGYMDYVVVDATGAVDRRRGIRLGELGVEVVEVFVSQQGGDPVVSANLSEPFETTDGVMQEEKRDPDGEEEGLEEVREALSWAIVEEDGTIARRRGIRLGEQGVEVLEVFQREVERAREEELEEEEEPWVVAQSKAGVCLEIDELTEELFYDKRVAEGGAPPDVTFEALFKAYSWVYRSGLLEQVKRLASTVLLALFPSWRERELIRRAMKAAGTTDPFAFFQQAALAFAKTSLREDLGQEKASLEQKEEQMLGARSNAELLEELAEEGRGTALFGKTVSLYVSQQTWESVVQLKEELGTSSNDEALRTLYRAYDWYYYNDPSPMMGEVEHLASTALSCLHLDADQQALIKQAMKYENATDLFDFLQELVLGYGECIVEEGQQKEQ